MDKDRIAETMTQFLWCNGLKVESLDLLIEILFLYREKNLDFAGALLATTALRKGPRIIYSFDRDLNRIDNSTSLSHLKQKAGIILIVSCKKADKKEWAFLFFGLPIENP